MILNLEYLVPSINPGVWTIIDGLNKNEQMNSIKKNRSFSY